MATTTCSTTAGVFNSREEAERAIAALKAAGYRDNQIGLVARDSRGKTTRTDGSGNTFAEEGAAIGAGVGAAAGVALGAGIMTGVIPVIGPILAIGPIAALLLDAAGGAAVGGVAGALIGWGLPEEDARYYEGEVKAGRYLVTVECGYGDDARDIVGDIVRQHGGYTRATAATR